MGSWNRGLMIKIDFDLLANNSSGPQFRWLSPGEVEALCVSPDEWRKMTWSLKHHLVIADWHLIEVKGETLQLLVLLGRNASTHRPVCLEGVEILAPDCQMLKTADGLIYFLNVPAVEEPSAELVLKMLWSPNHHNELIPLLRKVSLLR